MATPTRSLGMLVIIIENVRDRLESMGTHLNGGGNCGGGYKDGDDIHIDEKLNYWEQRLAVFHETLCGEVRGRIRHSDIDTICCKIINNWLEWEEVYLEKTRQLPDNPKIDWE